MKRLILNFKFYIIFLISLNANALTNNCTGIGLTQLNPNLNTLYNTANQITCINTKAANQCDKMEADLEGDDKNKIIQCDLKSLNNNNISDASLLSCMWNGVKVSGENLLNLTKLPGAIGEAVMLGFKQDQECNKNIVKKRQLLAAFNASVSDKRFKLEESFFGNRFEDMGCGEIERLTRARYDNYTQLIYRESINAKNAGKNYKMPPELNATNSDLLKTLDQAFKEAGVAYNCYTPKAKAEMICAGVTTLLVDFASGVGLAKAVSAISSIAKSKRALVNIKKAGALGDKADLADSAVLRMGDRSKAAEAILKRKLNPEEVKALKAAHEVGINEGHGYFTYTQKEIAEKADILAKAGFSKEERRSLLENGIAGAEGSVKPAGITYWHEQRIKGERLVNELSQTGNKEKFKQGLEEARKFYKQFLDSGDTKLLFTADRNGFYNLVRANEYGLSSKETAQAFEKSFGSVKKEAALNYRNAIGSLNNQIKEYEGMLTTAKSGKLPEGLEYKIYKAKELRGKLLETYYERKYPDKYHELDWEKMDTREQSILEKYRTELEKARAGALKSKLPIEGN